MDSARLNLVDQIEKMVMPTIPMSMRITDVTVVVARVLASLGWSQAMMALLQIEMMGHDLGRASA